MNLRGQLQRFRFATSIGQRSLALILPVSSTAAGAGRLIARFRFTLCALVCLLLPFLIPDANAQVFDGREQNLVNGLRDRGLYWLAEKHCLELLERQGLTNTDHASIAVERIRNQTSAALAGGAQAEGLRKVDHIVEEFGRSQGANPRVVLVGLQQALAHISFANMIEREVAAESADQERRAAGLDELRNARSILDRHRRKSTRILRQAANGNRTPGSLSSEQLRNLITSFDYQLAIVNLTTAQLLSNQTEMERLDRIDSLGRVLEQLSAVRASVSNTRALWWKTWINEATCRRMMGDVDAAARLLQTMQTKKRPKATDGLLLQEEIELAIAIGDSSQMQALARKAMKLSVDEETEIALLRLLVRAGQVKLASGFAARIAARSQPYWTRRADIALLSGSAAGSPMVRTSGAGDAATRLLLQAAQKADEAGNFEAALKGYRSVAEAQFSSGERAKGLATTAMAGKLLEKQNRHDEAADVYLRPAATYRDETLAPSIHLRGCWNLSKAKSDSFSDALKFHIDSWPKSETANQARLWLGSSFCARKKFVEAVEVLLKSSSESGQFPAAVNLAKSAGRKQLLIVASGNATTKQLAKRILGYWLDAYEVCESNAKPSLAVAMAELGFAWDAEPNLDTRARLEELASLPSARSAPEFLYWLGVAKGSLAEIESANQLAFAEDNVLQLLRSLNRIDSDSALAAIKLKIVDNAISATTVDRLRYEFKLIRAAALVELGQREDALQVLNQLVNSDPGNLAAKLALARILPPEAALKLWRTIASRTKAQSNAWFEAKYNVARLLASSGQREEAAKMLKYIKAIEPGWRESRLSGKFDRLLQKVTK